jgi:hypothetical protein
MCAEVVSGRRWYTLREKDVVLLWLLLILAHTR